MSELRTKQEAANYLKCSTRTIDRLRAQGLLRAVKVRGMVRFREQDLEALLKKHLES